MYIIVFVYLFVFSKYLTKRLNKLELVNMYLHYNVMTTQIVM